jgi:hypothetical protein
VITTPNWTIVYITIIEQNPKERFGASIRNTRNRATAMIRSINFISDGRGLVMLCSIGLLGGVCLVLVDIRLPKVEPYAIVLPDDIVIADDYEIQSPRFKVMDVNWQKRQKPARAFAAKPAASEAVVDTTRALTSTKHLSLDSGSPNSHLSKIITGKEIPATEPCDAVVRIAHDRISKNDSPSSYHHLTTHQRYISMPTQFSIKSIFGATLASISFSFLIIGLFQIRKNPPRSLKTFQPHLSTPSIEPIMGRPTTHLPFKQPQNDSIWYVQKEQGKSISEAEGGISVSKQQPPIIGTYGQLQERQPESFGSLEEHAFLEDLDSSQATLEGEMSNTTKKNKMDIEAIKKQLYDAQSAQLEAQMEIQASTLKLFELYDKINSSRYDSLAKTLTTGTADIKTVDQFVPRFAVIFDDDSIDEASLLLLVNGPVVGITVEKGNFQGVTIYILPKLLLLQIREQGISFRYIPVDEGHPSAEDLATKIMSTDGRTHEQEINS